MSSWNYRVINRAGDFAIHEVFYDESGKVKGWTETPVFPRAESLEGLAAELACYADAIHKPVIIDTES